MRICAGTLALVGILWVGPVYAEEFRGRILVGSMNEGRDLGWEIFNIRIDRYTPNAEHEYYLSLLAEPGHGGVQSALSEALAHVEAGRFQVQGRPSSHVAWVRTTPHQDGGRVVTIIGTRGAPGATRHVAPIPHLSRAEPMTRGGGR